MAEHWIDRELAALAEEFPENVEKRVRAAGFIIPPAELYPAPPLQPPTVIRYRSWPSRYPCPALQALPPGGD